MTKRYLLCSLLALGACRSPKGPADQPRRADQLIDRANDLLKNGQERRFNRFLDSAFRTFPEAGPGDRWKKYSQQANYYLNYEIDPARAQRYTDSMRQFSTDSMRYPDHYAQTLFTQGDVRMREHRFQEAFNHYYQGSGFAREHLDSCALSRFSNKLGLVKYRQGRYLEAVPYLKRALAQDRSCSAASAYLSHSIFNTLALCLERAGQPDSAIAYYRHALRLLAERPGPAAETEAARGVIYGNLGGLYAQTGNTVQAEHYLRQSIAINERPGYEQNDAVTARLKLADLYVQTSRYPEAAILLQAVQRKLNTLPQLRLRWLWSDGQYTERTAGPAAAYAALRRYDRFRDSLAEAGQGLKAADMETAFRAARQSQDLALKKLSLWFSLGLLLLATLIAWLLVRHNRSLSRSRGALREKTLFLEGLLGNLPVILYQIGPDGRITAAQGAGLNAVPGWTNDQLIGTDAFQLAPDMAGTFRAARQGEAARAINTFRANDQTFYFDTIVLPDATRPGGIIGFAVDLSENKRQAAQLEQLYQFKDKLLSVISHDLRQPLSAVLMATQLLQLNTHGLSKADLEQLLLDLGDTAAKGISLLEGLLIWVQTGSKDFSYQSQPIDLKDNIAEANGVYRYSQQQKQLRLCDQVHAGMIVPAHHQMLLFINRNLISNATKYSPPGGQITISAETTGPELIVTIRDEGPGMSAAQLSRLFKAQDRSVATAAQMPSAGIALSICADLIRQMQGRIWAESVPGQGSAFRYALPLKARWDNRTPHWDN